MINQLNNLLSSYLGRHSCSSHTPNLKAAKWKGNKTHSLYTCCDLILELVTERSTDENDSSEVRPTYPQDFDTQALTFGPAISVEEKINEWKKCSFTTFTELNRQMARIQHRVTESISNQRQSLHVRSAGKRFWMLLMISAGVSTYHVTNIFFFSKCEGSQINYSAASPLILVDWQCL